MTTEDREKLLMEDPDITAAFDKEELETLVGLGFLTAPASIGHHGSYTGGLFDHSYAVAKTLKEYTEALGLMWEDPASPIRVGLLHDLCKIDQYKLLPESVDEDGWTDEDDWKYADNLLITGHGTKSVIYIQRFMNRKMTLEEIACVTYHMGAFTDKKEWGNYSNACRIYPNVLFTHTADMAVSNVKGV